MHKEYFAASMLLIASTLAVAADEAAWMGGAAIVSDMHVPFVRNDGQVASEVAFHTTLPGGALFVTHQGAMLMSLPSRARPNDAHFFITVALVEAAPAAPVGVEPAETRVSFLTGGTSSGRAAHPATFQRVALPGVYDGIDLELRKHGGSVEKRFHVHPGGDPAAIRLRVTGAEELRVTEGGQLAMLTPHGAIRFTRPVAYTLSEGRQHPVRVAYRLLEDGYAFDVGQYDRGHRLVIDPILQATYLGSDELEESRAMAINPATGELYVVGTTPSITFPGTSGGAQASSGGESDAFVARLSADLTSVRQVTYLGGSGDDTAYVIAIAADGTDVYVAGATESPDFPVTDDALQSTPPGGTDGFVVRLDGTLTRLRNATYFGGSNNDRVFAMGLFVSETLERLYVAGDTLSDDLPATADAPYPTAAPGWNAFVASLDIGLARAIRTTYLGGSHIDHAVAMTVNPVNGKIIVAGYTRSDDFPGTADGARSTWRGRDDGFVAILEPDVRALRRATYLGGDGVDRPSGIALDPDTNDIFVVGFTDADDFPVTADGFQTERAGLTDMFVTRLDPGVMSIVQSTYLGGAGNDTADVAPAIALDPDTDTVYVAGNTYSDGFPGTSGGAQPLRGGQQDMVVARLAATLDRVEQATYLGGSGDEVYNLLVREPLSGDIYVLGRTDSDDFPQTAGGAQPDHAGSGDAFVVRLDATLAGDAGYKSLLMYAIGFIMAFGVLAVIGAKLTRKARPDSH